MIAPTTSRPDRPHPAPDRLARGGPRPARRLGRGRPGQVAARRRGLSDVSRRRTSGTGASTASPSDRTRTRSWRRSGSATGSIRTSGRTAATGSRTTSANHLTPKKTVTFRWKSESDKGPYPIPKTVKREAGSDHHILVVDKDACKLYELFAASKSSSGKWSAGSGAIWNLRLNRLRPDGWTSADAAGLPILPGLARYDEVAAGVIAHALRFTAPTTRTAHIYPARHDAGRRRRRRASRRWACASG